MARACLHQQTSLQLWPSGPSSHLSQRESASVIRLSTGSRLLTHQWCRGWSDLCPRTRQAGDRAGWDPALCWPHCLCAKPTERGREREFTGSVCHMSKAHKPCCEASPSWTAWICWELHAHWAGHWHSALPWCEWEWHPWSGETQICEKKVIIIIIKKKRIQVPPAKS